MEKIKEIVKRALVKKKRNKKIRTNLWWSEECQRKKIELREATKETKEGEERDGLR